MSHFRGGKYLFCRFWKAARNAMCILPDGGASTLPGLRICIVRRPGKRRATGMLPDKIYWAGVILRGRRGGRALSPAGFPSPVRGFGFAFAAPLS
ncbi:hypothetical protein EZ343_00110 [Salmonella enterica]|nr:hypothetical protein [Salmonella enterica]